MSSNPVAKGARGPGEVMKRGIYLYPWDLEGEGAETVLPLLRSAGLDSISLATSYHAGKFVRPHSPRGKVYFPEDGTVYFSANPARYGRIVPMVSRRVAGYDALRTIARHAPDMYVTGWTVGLHNTPQGLAHPELVVTNAYGDRLWNALCPAQPEVRRYLVGLCADLANSHPLHEIAVETPGWQAFRHGHHHEFELIILPQNAQVLLGMCFCDACIVGASAAGVDAAGLARRTRTELDRFFTDGTEPPDPRTDADWRAFLTWRAATVTSLVAEVAAALPGTVGLAVIPTTQSPNALCWVEGSDLRELARFARLELPAYQIGVPSILADIADSRAAAGDDARLGYILRPIAPNLSTADDVRRVVQEIGATGAASISFYNYGHMRMSSLDWIASALH